MIANLFIAIAFAFGNTRPVNNGRVIVDTFSASSREEDTIDIVTKLPDDYPGNVHVVILDPVK